MIIIGLLLLMFSTFMFFEQRNKEEVSSGRLFFSIWVPVFLGLMIVVNSIFYR
jgi:hypothetical protein